MRNKKLEAIAKLERAIGRFDMLAEDRGIRSLELILHNIRGYLTTGKHEMLDEAVELAKALKLSDFTGKGAADALRYAWAGIDAAMGYFEDLHKINETKDLIGRLLR